MIGKSQMPLSITSGLKDPLAEAVDALVVCVFAQGLAAHPTVIAVNKALGGALLEHAKGADFEAKVEQSLEVPALGRLRARRLVLVGAGAEKELTPARLRGVIAHAVRAGSLQNAERIALVAPSDGVSLREVGEGAALGAYRFTKYFTGERKPKGELSRIAVSLPSRPIEAAGKKALALGVEVAAAVAIARDAVNEPPNVVFPETLARIGRDIAKAHGLKVKVLDKSGILKAGMNLHYAVGQGSSNEPRFIHLTYTPSSKKKHKRLVFVGKGITFDSGGLCIKPAPGMGDMKSDMGGAAAVLGLMSAVAALKVPRRGARHHRRCREHAGRLRLPPCRHLHFARRQDRGDHQHRRRGPPGAGGCAHLRGALEARSDRRCGDADGRGPGRARQIVVRASTRRMRRSRRSSAMPLPTPAKASGACRLLEELSEQLKSDVADLKHTGDRYGGSITAALFLREFVAKVPWIHCDIAGPVLSERARGAVSKGATGHAVLTFLRFVETFSD